MQNTSMLMLASCIAFCIAKTIIIYYWRIIYIMDKPFVSITKIAESLGVNAQGQVTRLTNDKRFDVKLMKVKSTDNKGYNQYCIPEDQVDLFISTINPNRIGTAKKGEPVYTYINYDGKADYVKIGKTTNPKKRLRTHQSSHTSIQTIHLIEGDKEQYFKTNFSHLMITNNCEHYFITAELLQAWESFEDVSFVLDA